MKQTNTPKMNNLNSNEAAASQINRLEGRCKLLTAERNTAREEAERNMKWLQERNEEVDQLKAQIAILERNHTLVCGQRDTAKEVADMWYKMRTEKI